MLSLPDVKQGLDQPLRRRSGGHRHPMTTPVAKEQALQEQRSRAIAICMTLNPPRTPPLFKKADLPSHNCNHLTVPTVKSITVAGRNDADRKSYALPDQRFQFSLRSHCTAMLAGLRTLIQNGTGRIDRCCRSSSIRCPRHQAGRRAQRRQGRSRQCVR